MHHQANIVDLAFPVRGERLPLDHGYALFSAISQIVPQLHTEPTWAVHPIHGQRQGREGLRIGSRSAVKLRVPADRLVDLLPLIGATLELAGRPVVLGPARVHRLVPAATLQARIVTIKKFLGDPEPFRRAALRQLARILGLAQDPPLIELIVGPRRVLRVRNHTVVGFAMVVQGLTAEASLALQHHGLGGRRHMGAGVFVPPGRRGPGYRWRDRGTMRRNPATFVGPSAR